MTPDSRILIFCILVTELAKTAAPFCYPLCTNGTLFWSCFHELEAHTSRTSLLQPEDNLRCCQVLKIPWKVEILMEGRHKQDLSFKQSFHRDMTFTLDLTCEVFYRHIIQFLTLKMVPQTCYCCRITTMHLLFIEERLGDSTEIPQTSCYRRTKQDASSPPWCVQESRGSGWKNLPWMGRKGLLTSKRVHALGEHWSSTS